MTEAPQQQEDQPAEDQHRRAEVDGARGRDQPGAEAADQPDDRGDARPRAGRRRAAPGSRAPAAAPCCRAGAPSRRAAAARTGCRGARRLCCGCDALAVEPVVEHRVDELDRVEQRHEAADHGQGGAPGGRAPRSARHRTGVVMPTTVASGRSATSSATGTPASPRGPRRTRRAGRSASPGRRRSASMFGDQVPAEQPLGLAQPLRVPGHQRRADPRRPRRRGRPRARPGDQPHRRRRGAVERLTGRGRSAPPTGRSSAAARSARSPPG